MREILDEEGGHDHADAVVHDPAGPEFAHARVDDGVTRSALLPEDKVRLIHLPGEGGELGTEWLFWQIGAQVQQVIGELAPENFLQELLGRPVEAAIGGRLRRPDRMPALCRTDLAEMQVGGKS